MDVLQHALQNQGKRTAFTSVDRPVEKLSLTSLSMRRNDETPRNLISHIRAKITTDKMQAKIETGRATRRSENLALVDIEHVRVDAYARESTPQSL
jgi:hypothetical protein